MGGAESRVRNRWLWLLVALGGFANFFFIFGLLPSSGVPVLFTISLGIALTAVIAIILLRLSKRGMGKLNDLGLASGFLTLLLFLDPILEVSRPTPEDFRVQTAVGVAFVLFLILLGRKVDRREAMMCQLGKMLPTA